MPNLKILSVLVGGIVALLCLALIAVWLWVDPNNYKDKITASVKESTGHELKLPGRIRLTVFPWVALEVGPASLENPAGFGDDPFLSFTHATLRVRLLPLLRRRLEAIRLDIDGLDLRLNENAKGEGNWQETVAENAPIPSAGIRGIRSPRPLEALLNVSIHNGRVSYHDIIIENFDVESGSAADRRIPITAKFDANRGIAGEHLWVNARFDLSEDSARQMQLAAVNLNGTLSRPVESRPIPWEISSPNVHVDLAQQTLRAPAIAFSYAGAHMSGSLAIAKIPDDFNMTGSLALAPLVLREFFPSLGIAVPKTRDPKALSQLSASTDFTLASNALSLKHIQARLDDTEVQGEIKFSAGEPHSLQYDLTADKIDLDRYRAAEGSAAEHDAKSPAASRDQAVDLQAEGTLALMTARFSRMDLSNLRLTVVSKANVTHLFPVEAQIDGGRYSGDITLDSRGAVPVLSVNEHLIDIDMARLLANTAQKGRLSGRATLNLKGVARGATVDALLKTLNGHVDADLADGAFEGIDLGYQVGRARALFDRQAAPRDDTKRTKFDAFRTSAQITDGLAETHDLTISSQALRVTGQGSVKLATQAIDFQLTASILKAPTTTLIDIPFTVTGTYTDPAVKTNLDAAKTQLKQKLQEILKKNGLQGLFGK